MNFFHHASSSFIADLDRKMLPPAAAARGPPAVAADCPLTDQRRSMDQGNATGTSKQSGGCAWEHMHNRQPG